MKDIFFHIDNLKHIFKENEGKSKESSNYDYNNNKPITISRPSILNLNKHIKRANFSHKFYLIEDSSDSEDCLNEETKETFPSLMKVAKSIFDPYKIMITTDIKYFPREANPGLIMSGIEDWVTEKHIKYFLENVPTFVDQCRKNKYYEDNVLDIYNIKIFVEQQKRYAFIQLKYSQMRAIGEFFLNPIKKDFPSLNSKKEKIEIYYAYNIFDLTKNHWYGVIFRNLPPNCDDKSLYNFTEERVENGIKYCLNPIPIDNIYCALIVCKELEYAEKLCNDLNNMKFNSKTFKVHLHPYTCKIRNRENCNIYETFSKDGYEFDKIADESEKCLEYSKNFMEFFFSNYINSFKYNRRKKEEETVKNNEKNKNQNDNKNNNKIEKGKSKKKDLILASSIIMDLFKKQSNSENTNKNNGNKLNKETGITNIENNISNNINNNKSEEQKIEKKENSENKIADNSENKTNIKKEDNEITNKNSNNMDISKEPGEMDDLNIDPKSRYSENEINYYTYNMGDKNYYDDKEKEEQRKNYKKNSYYSNYNKNNNYSKNNYNNNNNHNNYNNNYNNNNNYGYKKKNNISYHHPYSSSNQKNFSKYNYRDKDKDKDREYNNDNYSKQRERSREKSNEQGIINKNRDKYNNEYDKRRDNSNNRYPEDRDRDRDRNRKYNGNKYHDKKNKYYDKEKNSRHSQSKDRNRNNRNDRNDRNDRKERYNYSYNKYNSNKFK